MCSPILNTPEGLPKAWWKTTSLATGSRSRCHLCIRGMTPLKQFLKIGIPGLGKPSFTQMIPKNTSTTMATDDLIPELRSEERREGTVDQPPVVRHLTK